MTSPRCPISDSTRVKLIEKISVEDIRMRYKDLCPPESLPFDRIDFVLKYRSLDTGYEFFYPFSLTGGGALYESLGAYDWYYLPDKWEHEEALHFIKKDDHLLEVGCGRGAFLKLLKTNLQNDAVGIELNPSACKAAQQAGLKVYNQDLTVYGNDNKDRFDVVCQFQVLEHVAGVREFLHATLNVLKPGGRLILCVPNNDSFIKNDRRDALNLPPHHMGRWNAQSLRSLILYFDLRLEEVRFEPLAAYHVDWYIRTHLMHIFGERIFFRILNRRFIINPLRKFVRLFRSRIRGHSILVVYQKK